MIARDEHEARLYMQRAHRCNRCRAGVQRATVQRASGGHVVSVECHGAAESMLVTPTMLEDHRGSWWWFVGSEVDAPPAQRIELHVYFHGDETKVSDP